METTNNSTGEAKNPRKSIGIFLLPVALLPFLALLTYDWRTIETLAIPPQPSANLVGVVGDVFAYYGYNLFGLGLWLVPPAILGCAVFFIFGGMFRFGRRTLALLTLFLSIVCLLQLLGAANPIAYMLSSLNLPDAGGLVGYLLMNRCLARFISPFSASVLMASIAVFAAVTAIGLRTLIALIGNFVGGKPLTPEEEIERAERAREKEERANAAREAREVARAAREAEKQRIADEREKARLAKQQAKEELRAQREAERDAQRIVSETEKANQDIAAREAALAAREAALRAREIAAAERTAAKAVANTAAANTAKVTTPPTAAPVSTSTSSDTAATTNATAEEVPQGPYVLPPLNLLAPAQPSSAEHGDVNAIANALVNTLATFGVKSELAGMVTGPVVTQFKLRPDPTVKVERIPALSGNLQLALAAKSIRIQAPIPGEPAVGIEVPNPKPGGVAFGDIIRGGTWSQVSDAAPNNRKKMYVPLCLGKDAAGNDLVADLASMPHLLVAGATGQGKSVCLNSIINGLLMCRTPEQLRLIMVDPKRVEFTSYNRLPHLLVPIVNDTNKVVFALRWALVEMEKRLKMFGRAGCRNIVDFNNRQSFDQPDLFGESAQTKTSTDVPKTIPYIVIIIDEVADIMQTSRKEVEPVIARLTALARATGIHLILATQRPDAKIITGVIKSNIPGRIAFKTSSSIDSRTILDDTGSEDLIGRGDMLFKTKEGNLVRAQGSFISDPEINSIVEFIAQHAPVNFDKSFAERMAKIKEANAEDELSGTDEEDSSPTTPNTNASANDKDDALYRQALEVVRTTRRASTSHLQRKMQIGYNHAARLIELLEERGIIGPAKGAGPRDILVDLDAPPEIVDSTLEPTSDTAGEAVDTLPNNDLSTPSINGITG